MKKILFVLVLLLFISCVTTNTKKNENRKPGYPWSTFNSKAGEEIQMPVDCGIISYGQTTIRDDNWDFSIPKEFGKKVLITSFPYTYYYDGKKIDVYYEVIIKDINLKPEIRALPNYAEIKEGTVIGTADADNPGIMLRTVTGYDPNLVMDSKNPPVESGNYTYFDASSFMKTTPKILTFQPVSSKKDLIDFKDYPESLESIVTKSQYEKDDEEHILRLPNFRIRVKAKLDKYPEPIRTASNLDVILRHKFYSFCNTETEIDFDGIPFHLVFYKDFEKYLADEYKPGEDIYLYLVYLFGRAGEQFFYVRDFSLKSPEQMYDEKLDLITEILAQ